MDFDGAMLLETIFTFKISNIIHGKYNLLYQDYLTLSEIKECPQHLFASCGDLAYKMAIFATGVALYELYQRARIYSDLSGVVYQDPFLESLPKDEIATSFNRHDLLLSEEQQACICSMLDTNDSQRPSIEKISSLFPNPREQS